MAHQCDHANNHPNDLLPLPPLITCWIRHLALFRDLEIYKLSTAHTHTHTHIYIYIYMCVYILVVGRYRR